MSDNDKAAFVTNLVVDRVARHQVAREQQIVFLRTSDEDTLMSVRLNGYFLRSSAGTATTTTTTAATTAATFSVNMD